MKVEEKFEEELENNEESNEKLDQKSMKFLKSKLRRRTY